MKLAALVFSLSLLTVISGCRAADALKEESRETCVSCDSSDSTTTQEGYGSDEETDCEIGTDKICPLKEEQTCSEIIEGPIPLSFSLETTSIEDAEIHSVAADIRQIETDYTIGIAGVGRRGGRLLPFIIVYRTGNPEEYSVNWWEEGSGGRVHGLRTIGDMIDKKFCALLCQDVCFIVCSQATSQKEDTLSRLDGIDKLAGYQINGVARGEGTYSWAAFGDGIVRLEEDGSWNELSPPGSGPPIRAAWVDGSTIVAVGDRGRIVIVNDGVITERDTGMIVDFTSVWARNYSGSGLDTPVQILHAFSKSGQAFFTDHLGNGAVCPFVKNVISAFLSGGAVRAVTEEGNIYVTGVSVTDLLQCKSRSFAGPVKDSNAFFCAASGHMVGWDTVNVYASSYAGCVSVK